MARMTLVERARAVGMLQAGTSVRQKKLTIKMFLNVQSGTQSEARTSFGFSRQSSVRSSIKSNRSSSSLRQKKMAEHELIYNTNEWQKRQDYQLIRERRETVRKHIDSKLRVVRRLYIPAIIIILLGIAIIFCSTVQSIGKGTAIWTYRKEFTIVGTVVLVVGVILLLTTVGLENVTVNKINKDEIEPLSKTVIHPDFLKEPPKISIHSSFSKESTVNDEKTTRLEYKKHAYTMKRREESCICRSLPSASSLLQSFNSSVPSALSLSQRSSKLDRTAKWANEVAISFDSGVIDEENISEYMDIENSDTINVDESNRDEHEDLVVENIVSDHLGINTDSVCNSAKTNDKSNAKPVFFC